MNSAEFRANLREVRVISDTRTNEQVRIAQYWEGLGGSFNAGAWNAVARRAIAQHGLSEPDSARVLATMHMAGVRRKSRVPRIQVRVLGSASDAS
jgi:hypothetical protein